MKFDIELVGKIGSMALINEEKNDLDYNKFARIGKELRPGIVWVSSGATEIGRLDYIKRMGCELKGDSEDNKTDYSAQGQAILMQTYRMFVNPNYNIRQVLVEHQHFNNEEKREHIRNFLFRCVAQKAIPIINYNDAVSCEENRRMEIAALKKNGGNHVVELVDNDETASLIACLVKTKRLLILTSVDGIYKDPKDPSTLIEEISGKDIYEVLDNIEACKALCQGSSRIGAGGAAAKLEYIKEPVKMGTLVYIANAKYSIKDILEGKAKRTFIGVR
ncbi:MAG: uridylate kinase [Clostridiales bacterium]|jgi:glutamate 5-kinase|nr:uridylate kinase [Clostridiales bacterium]